MAYKIELKPSAARALEKLPKADQERIAEKIDSLAGNPRPPEAKILKGREGLIRIRAGVYRIIYRVDENRRLVVVVKIGHRREVYRGF